MTGLDVAQRRALARAVLQDRTVHEVLPSNARGRALCLDEAVAGDIAFFGTVRPDILALDLDGADAAERAAELVTKLLAEGFAPVLCASGQEGRRHIFCRVQTQRAAMEVLGLRSTDALRRTNIRPPATLHRSREVRSELIYPSDPAEAVMRLQGRDRRRPLGPAGLSHLRRAAATDSRSEAVFSLALSAVNAGWTFEDFAYLAFEGSWPFCDQVRSRVEDRGVENTQRWLERGVWIEAVDHVRANPPRHRGGPTLQDREDVTWTLETLRGHSMSSQLRVMCALVGKRAACGVGRFNMSSRDLALASGLSSHDTVDRAVLELTNAGHLHRSPVPASRRLVDAAAWKVNLPHPGGALLTAKDCSSIFDAVAHDLFRNKVGLGSSHLCVYLHVLARPGIQFNDLVAQAGYERRTLRSAVVGLQKLGVLVEKAGGLEARPDRLDQAAAELGSQGRRELQELQHLLEREGRDQLIRAS